ncbi:DUF6385 domain-containing protein [Clostridium thermarum]|uniref:DUF6385 domain-containing protein n=1 Tax=Clostridium thermarum TaxID=1716543 RepID=UPI00111FEE00|nr:DUF6385 domain-containing protein [Clostridium thermarum]
MLTKKNIIYTGDAGKQFKESSYKVTTSANYCNSKEVNTSQYSIITFFAVNEGGDCATVKLQISPNNSLYIDDGEQVAIKPGEMKAFVPMIFAKYTRLCYKSSGSNSTILKIIVQGWV